MALEQHQKQSNMRIKLENNTNSSFVQPLQSPV